MPQQEPPQSRYLRFARLFKLRRRQGKKLSKKVETATEKYFFSRFERLLPVRKFVISWLLLVVLLCGCLAGQIIALDDQFKSLQPISGGIHIEGVLGDFTNANPLYATNSADESVSRLVFASLFKYDDNNELVGDLAEDYSIDATGRIYTVKLKPDLTWHDGEPLTSQDVVFTYQMIQNPDALSVLNKGWQGIQVASTDIRTVTFTLPNGLGSFPYNMTNGIIPKHLLKDVSPAEMRSISFNTASPVGSGPFVWKNIEVTGSTPETRQAQIAFTPFRGYHAGTPKVGSFIIHTYHDPGQLKTSFDKRELTAATFSDVPDELAGQKGVEQEDFIMSAANMAFFKHSHPALSDAAVRKALVQAVNVDAIVQSLSYPTRAVRGPFLQGQLGYDKTLIQPGFDTVAAIAALDKAGWVPGAGGIRAKGAQPLKLSLYAQDTAESRQVTEQLKKAWRSIGADLTVRLYQSEDLQRAIDSREYDILLYGISVGVDPDVFVYWHSSQNDARSSRLNFAEFASKPADTALEAGRTRVEPDLRAVKYKPFLQAWQQDTPALGLYQPRLTYLTRGKVYGMEPHTITTNADRFSNVHNWQVRQAELVIPEQ